MTAEPLVAGSVPLDAELAALAELGRSRGLLPLPAIPVAEARERITVGNGSCAAGPETVAVEDHQVPVDGGSITVRVYRPEQPPAATLLYLHGGGWITGDLGYGDELCRFLARGTGSTVVSADYRLSPEHPFPVPLEDAYAALLWTDTHVRGDGPLGIVGDSAGGNLAAACTLRARDAAGPRIDVQLLVYPVTDTDFERPSYRTCTFPLGRADMQYCFDLYAPSAADRRTPAVSPLRATSHAGLPPAVVVVAGHDPLYDEGVAYAQVLEDAGVPVRMVEHPTLCHGFLRFTGVSQAARDARRQVVAEAAALLAGSSTLTEQR